MEMDTAATTMEALQIAEDSIVDSINADTVAIDVNLNESTLGLHSTARALSSESQHKMYTVWKEL
jgi:hypothetical protein